MQSLQNRIIITFIALTAVVMLATSALVQHDVEKTVHSSQLQHAKDVLDQVLMSIENEHKNNIFHRQALYSERRELLESITNIAIKIVEKIYKQAVSGEISQEQAMHRAKEAIRAMRYSEGTGYLWIQDDTLPIPRMLMHPTVPGLEGRLGNDPLYYKALDNKTNLMAEFVRQVKKQNGTAFLPYRWPKPTPRGLTAMQPKSSHVRLFKPWGWIIGTGVYTDDIEMACQKHQDIIRQELFKKVASVRIAESGYFYIFDGTGNILVHSELAGTNGLSLKIPGTDILLLPKLMEAARHPDPPFEYTFTKPGEPASNHYKKVAIVRYFKPLDWYVGVSPYVDELKAPATALRTKILWSSLVFLIIAALISWWIARNISTPLSMLAKASRQIEQEGMTGVQIPITGTIETQTLGDCLQNMIKSLQKKQDELQIMSFLVTSAATPIAMSDLQGNLIHVNPAFLQTWGYNGEAEVIGRPFSEFWIVADSMNKVIENIQKKSLVLREEKAIGFNGSTFSVLVSASMVSNDKGKPIAMMCSALDITKQKQTEEELKQARNYITNIIDSMPSILVGVDFNGKITQWNSKTQQETGVSAQKAIGQPLDIVIPRLKNEIGKIKKAIASQQQQIDTRQKRFEKGEIYYEDITVYPLTGENVEGAVIRVDDVTEQVQLEDMMVQSEKMLSVGGLAAGMAHEINNPLAGIMQTAHVITNRLTKFDIPANKRAAEEVDTTMEIINAFMEKREIIDMLNNIHTAGSRAAEIVQNMLSFARKTDSSFSTHSVTELLDQCVDLAGSDYDLKKKFDFRQIKIIRKYEDNLPSIPCEPSRIQQVLLNILRNGAEAMQDTAKTAMKFELKIFHEKQNNMVCIEIKDNGPGMDEDTRKRVFEPFFTTKPTDRGTGLGLSVSYFIINENHHGKISVESQKGSGTKFIIKLPVKES